MKNKKWYDKSVTMLAKKSGMNEDEAAQQIDSYTRMIPDGAELSDADIDTMIMQIMEWRDDKRRDEDEDDNMTCPKCGYQWRPRTENPKECPRCKRRLDRPTQKDQKDQ